MSQVKKWQPNYSLILLSWKAKWLEINFLISEAWAERDLLHSTSLSSALYRPRLYDIDYTSFCSRQKIRKLISFEEDFLWIQTRTVNEN